jgi:hypothetical protein
MRTRHHSLCVGLFHTELQYDMHYISAITCYAGHWAKGSLGQAYIEKNPLAALQAFAIASGWEQSSFIKRHFLGRALVSTIEHVYLCKKKCRKADRLPNKIQSNFCCFGIDQFTCTLMHTSC